MMAIGEIVYLGDYDNTNDFRLESDSIALDMSSVTQINANINGVDIVSTNQSSDIIRWDLAGYGEGEIRCKLGATANLNVGLANLWFLVFDPTNANGVVFGPIILELHLLP
jgi:hypothetical protein